MGFKDGTNNIKAESSRRLDDFVWVGDETDQPWMNGGSYLVARRIRMLIESWDTDVRSPTRRRSIGRIKTRGAPLDRQRRVRHPSTSTPRTADGQPVIAARRPHPARGARRSTAAEKILRRGYSYTDGIDPTTGQLDAGLFFIAFQKDPRQAVRPDPAPAGRNDNLNEYIKHTSSGVFAVPPGLSRGR